MMDHGMMGMGMMDHGMMGMGMMDRQMGHAFYLDRADELGLSADQVAKLKVLQSDSRKDNIRNAAEVKIARLELADLLDGKDWSLKDAEPLIRKVQKLEGDIQVRYLQAVSDARKVLTAEQLKQASLRLWRRRKNVKPLSIKHFFCSKRFKFMQDPVCGMQVTPESKGGIAQWQDETYTFCSDKCRIKFVADPESFLHPEPPTAENDAAAADAIYTCPMHPEVERRGPGSCPICGMALESKEISTDLRMMANCVT